MKATELYEEIAESLLRGADIWVTESGLPSNMFGELQGLMRERARNLAMAMAPRMLSEQVLDLVELSTPVSGSILDCVKINLDMK